MTPEGPGEPGGSPLRIAYVLGTTAGGTGPHVAMLAAGCAARGMAVRVFGPAETGRRYFAGQDGDGAPGFAVVPMADRPRPARDVAAVVRLRRLLRDWAPDVVHAHGLRAAGFAALERLAARRSAAVTWVSGDLGARMRRAGAADGGRAVVAASPAVAPGADQVAAARAELGGPDRPAVLAAGRLAEQKGFGVLIEAAARWQDRSPAPVLAIAGDGPLAGVLASQARAARVPVRFLGWRDDVPALMAAADVVVVPSLWEGQPLIVQEALRAGRPLVASRAGGIPDLTGEDGALLVPPGDAVALAGAVRSVFDDRGMADRLRTAATQRSAALPTSRDAVDAAVAVYRRVLRAAAGRTEQKI